MKPRNWDTMDHAARREYAEKLLGTARGHYLLAQALHYGIKSLSAIEPPVMREQSNIEDMQMLSLLFEPMFSLFNYDVQAEINTALGRKNANLQ